MANECKILNLIEQKSFWQNIIEFDEKFEFVKKLGQGEYLLSKLWSNFFFVAWNSGSLIYLF